MNLRSTFIIFLPPNTVS